MLVLSNITKHYTAGDTTVEALRGVSTRFRKNEFVSILGPSGCGKTTLLNIIGGLDRYTDGDLMIRGRSTKEYKDRDWDTYRNHSVGFVFQNYNLVPVLNVYENIVLPIQLDGNTPDADYIKSIVETLGLGSKLKNLASNLSGGQQQRVAIARALSTKPAIILADEPTGNLDSKTSLDVLKLLKMTSEKYSQTIVIITHDEQLAQLADRIVRIEDGRIVSQ